MDHICAHCTRQLLRQPRVSHRARPALQRAFSKLSSRQAGPIDLSADEPGTGINQPTRKVLNRLIDKTPSNENGPKIHKFHAPDRAPPTRTPQPQVLTRTRPTSSPTSSHQTQPRILTRTRTPTTIGLPAGIRYPPRNPSTPSRTPPLRRRRGPDGQPRPDGRRTTDAELKREYAGDDNTTRATVDAYIQNHIDPPMTPQTSTPYNPKTPQLSELRKDWPNTPLSSTGLTETVVQKMTFLANRLPHGYWTPGQLRERLSRGHLVRFESEEEMDAVLGPPGKRVSKGPKRAAEVKGEEFDPKKVTRFSSIEARKGEKGMLVSEMVKGEYPMVEKQSRSFMEGVARQLRNNETYGGLQQDKFMGRLTKLLQDSGFGGQQQQKGAVQKNA